MQPRSWRHTPGKWLKAGSADPNSLYLSASSSKVHPRTRHNRSKCVRGCLCPVKLCDSGELPKRLCAILVWVILPRVSSTSGLVLPYTFCTRFIARGKEPPRSLCRQLGTKGRMVLPAAKSRFRNMKDTQHGLSSQCLGFSVFKFRERYCRKAHISNWLQIHHPLLHLRLRWTKVLSHFLVLQNRPRSTSQSRKKK